MGDPERNSTQKDEVHANGFCEDGDYLIRLCYSVWADTTARTACLSKFSLGEMNDSFKPFTSWLKAESIHRAQNTCLLLQWAMHEYVPGSSKCTDSARVIWLSNRIGQSVSLLLGEYKALNNLGLIVDGEVSDLDCLDMLSEPTVKKAGLQSVTDLRHILQKFR